MPPTIEEKSKSPVYGSIEASKDQEDTNQAIESDGILCRVLVTGGAGFIGSHLVEALLLLGHEVAILDNFNDYYSPAIKRSNISEIEDRFGLDSFQLFEGDMSDPAFSQQVFESFRPTHVIHLAARAGVRASIDEPMLYVRTNLEATTLLMNLSATFGVRHFLFASSSSVYGESHSEVFRESDNTDAPLSPYGATKKACELMASTYSYLYNLPCTGFRFFTVYGPRCRPDMAPFKFIHRIANGIPIQRYGDGSTERDYTFVSDIVAGIMAALDKPSGFRIFNLGNGHPVLLSTFISTIERVLDKQAIIEELPPQPGDVPRTSASIDLARKELNFQPSVNIDEGLKLTADWYLQKIVNEGIEI